MEMLLLTVTVVAMATATAMGALAWRMARAERTRSAARIAALRAANPDLFGAAAAPAGASAQHGLAWAAGALLLVVGVAGVAMYSGDSAPTAATVDAAPLELLTLNHDRDGATVNLSGLVRNPEGGTTVEGLTAVVFLFDGEGGFLTSARAPVDFLTLAPGDDTPFVVALPAPSNATRYRVSFRTDAGTVPHVDRRAPTAAADAGMGTR